MVKYIIYFIILINCAFINAQSVFNVELIKKIKSSSPSDHIQVLVLAKPHTVISFSSFQDVKLQYQVGNIYSITGSIQSIKQISQQENCVRIEYIQHHLTLMDDTGLVRNRLKAIHLGSAPLPQAYDGAGVIVGIIDTGTDFTHPDFKDASGKSKIKFLWDMAKPVAVNTPTVYGYGQEWTNSDIDAGLCTHDDAPNYGHGTASSGIAAGNGLAINKHEGSAPNADIIVVALDFNKSGFIIADALKYIIDKSVLLNKPLVVNASVGEYYGSHDATDLEAKIIEGLITNVPGRALVASAGNAGSIRFHVGYPVTIADTNFTWIANGAVAPIELSEFADTNGIKQVKYSIGVNNTGFQNLGNIGFKDYDNALNTIKYDTIYHASNRIGVIETVSSINSYGIYELSIKIKADSAGYFWRIEHTGTGRIDSWNFDYVTTGLPSPGVYPNISKYKAADTLQSIVSSFQCSDEVITVGNYVNRNQYQDVNNVMYTTTEVPGQIAASSSNGPTRNNKIKPDITASGATMLAPAATAMLPNLIATYPYVVGLGGMHISAGGTSASSPVVAGWVALFLQKNPTATNRQIKESIINCAYRDGFTGSTANYRWGYGKLDGFSSMACDLTSVHTISRANEEKIEVIPNPILNQAQVIFETNEPRTLKLYNSSGQLVLEDVCTTDRYLLKKNELSAGIYVLICNDSKTVYKKKLLIL